MRTVALILLLVGIVVFAGGLMWHEDSRERMWANVVTISSVYVGVVLWFSAEIR